MAWRSAQIHRHCTRCVAPICRCWHIIIGRGGTGRAAPAIPSAVGAIRVEAGSAVRRHCFSDDSHPYLGVAMDRCIHCERCVRICEEVQASTSGRRGTWGAHPCRAGSRADVAGKRLRGLWCLCRHLPERCLVRQAQSRPGGEMTRSTCVYCGVGCQMNVGSRAGQVVAVRPAAAGQSRSFVRQGALCVRICPRARPHHQTMIRAAPSGTRSRGTQRSTSPHPASRPSWYATVPMRRACSARPVLPTKKLSGAEVRPAGARHA